MLTAGDRHQAILLGRRLRSVLLPAIRHGPLPRAELTACLIGDQIGGVPLHRSETAGDYVPLCHKSRICHQHRPPTCSAANGRVIEPLRDHGIEPPPSRGRWPQGGTRAIAWGWLPWFLSALVSPWLLRGLRVVELSMRRRGRKGRGLSVWPGEGLCVAWGVGREDRLWFERMSVVCVTSRS
jgi:hypothetical protein